jgi:hypothetical protein
MLHNQLGTSAQSARVRFGSDLEYSFSNKLTLVERVRNAAITVSFFGMVIAALVYFL